MNKIYLLFSAWLSFLLAFGFQPLTRNFTRGDYRAGTQNWDICQDSLNQIFIANNSGMLQFNGKNWNLVPIINGTNVRSLNFDGDNRIYASTFNDFGFFSRNTNGLFEYASLTNDPAFSTDVSNEIYHVHTGNKKVFFRGNRSIYIYQDNKLVKIPFGSEISYSALHNNILWLASDEKGIFILNGNMFVKLPGSDILAGKGVCSILPLPDNRMLIVTRFDGTYISDGNLLQKYDTGIDSFLKDNQVFCASISGNKIAYGTIRFGVAVQDIKDGSTQFINSFTGLQNNTVLCTYFDNMQNLWLGLDKGVDYVQLNSPVNNVFGNNNIYGSGYASAIFENKIYLGTNQGLYQTSYPLKNDPLPQNLQMTNRLEGQIWCLEKIQGTLFCGNDNGAFTIRENRIERIPELPGTWSFQQSRKDPDKILGCSYNGLFILQKTNGTWKFSRFIAGNFKESSPMFIQDDDGIVWFSHWQKGMYRLKLNPSMDSIISIKLYDQEKGFPNNHNNTVFRIAGQIIFSTEGGFFTYDKKTDRMLPYQRFNKLFASTPRYMRLHEGPSGEIWFTSGRFLGLARNPDVLKFDSLSFSMLQGKMIMGFENFNYADKHHLLVGTEDGFSQINLAEISDFSNRENGFRVFLQRVVSTGNNLIHSLSSSKKDPSLFSATENSIRFEFIAPEYRDNDLVRYSYLLENYDMGWSEFSSENIKEYNRLPKGDYIFHVRAKNRMENNLAELEYHFTILPAWYESGMAITIYFLIFIFLVFRLVIWVNNRSRLGALEMEKKKELEIEEHKKVFEEERQAKKREIKELKNQQLQYELRHKSQELASSTMNLIRKNEILMDIVDSLNKTTTDLQKEHKSETVLRRLKKIESQIRENIQGDNNWKKFEENFDLVYENYLRRLGEEYPDLNVNDKKICAYIKMNLSSKDMAQLLNMSVRSVETHRYRIRKKLGLSRDVNLSDYLQKF